MTAVPRPTGLETHPAFTWVGHRGAGVTVRSAYIENTLPSFEAAIQQGADMLEFDIQMSSDGDLLLFHDDMIGPNHSTGLSQDVMINDCRSDMLQALPLGTETITIPRLDTLFKQFKGRTTFYCELKHHPNLGTDYHHSLAQKCIALISSYGLEKDCLIVSFNREILAYCATLNPSLRYGLNLSKSSPISGLQDLTIHCICPDFEHHQRLVPDTWCGAVIPYNVNTPEAVQVCLSAGYSGITTDDLTLKNVIKTDTHA